MFGGVMADLLQPKYLVAVFVVIMMFLSYYQGYRLGKKRAAAEIFRALGVPKSARITGVMYGPARAGKQKK
jgi:hypothetical protein